jgi:hypothetical protein
MGSELSTKSAIQLEARVQGTAPLTKLEWIGPEGVLNSQSCSNAQAQSEVELSARWVYLRVTQSDEQMAWTSPIFSDF